MKYKTYTLQELATIKYGKNQKKVVCDKGSIPIYGTGGLMGYATQALYDKPSVLIGRKGTIDKVKYVTHPFWTVDTLFYTEIKDDIVLPHYLFYLLSCLDLRQYNEGTTIPSLRTETLNRLEFSVPTIHEQQQILDVLEPIEDKIELNNKINNNFCEYYEPRRRTNPGRLTRACTKEVRRIYTDRRRQLRPNDVVVRCCVAA